jgi:hypothetical protein
MGAYMDAYYWGLNNDEWRTISIVLQGLLMIILTGIGVIQLIALQRTAKETKRSRTWETCRWGEADPILYDCKCSLSEARLNGDLYQNHQKYRIKIYQLLNYYEDVAIGIKRGIYEEDFAHDHLGSLLRISKKLYLEGELAKKLQLASSKTYENLKILAAKWDKRPDASMISPQALEIVKKPEIAQAPKAVSA